MSRRRHVPDWRTAEADRRVALRERREFLAGIPQHDPTLLAGPWDAGPTYVDRTCVEAGPGSTYTFSAYVRPPTDDTWKRISETFRTLGQAMSMSGNIQAIFARAFGPVDYPNDFFIDPPPAWEYE